MGMTADYRVLMLLAAVFVLTTGTVRAKLPEVVPSIMINYVNAIHRPTGCVAKLEFNGKILLGAAITDPLCLPRDVKARSIPAFKHDFHVPGKQRRMFTGH